MHYLLLIAYYLSILTFYLGAIMYLLPIPLSGLKRWGPRLISDAFLILVLALTVDTIFSVADFVRLILGGDWTRFLTFVKGLIAQNTLSIIILSQAQYALSRIGLSKILSIVTQSIAYSLYALLMLYIISVIIKSSYEWIASLGIALMAIPFRIARNAGAFLLAFSIVFYTALPLYPSFVSLFVTGYSQASTSLILGHIINENGTTITSGFISLKDERTGKMYGLIPISKGAFYILSLPKDLNLSDKITLYYDVDGHLFFTNVTNMTIRQLCNVSSNAMPLQPCIINVRVYGIAYYNNGIAVHVNPWPKRIHVFYNSYDHTLCINLSCEKCDLYISFTMIRKIDSVCIDGQCMPIQSFMKYCWTWYGLDGCTAVLHIQGDRQIVAKLSDTSTPSEPLLSVSPFGNLYSISSTISLENAARLLYVQLISSILYLAVLTSISLGLARLLGGTSRLRVV